MGLEQALSMKVIIKVQIDNAIMYRLIRLLDVILQSLGLALVHAHTRLAAEHPDHNRSVEVHTAKTLDFGGTMWPMKLTR